MTSRGESDNPQLRSGLTPNENKPDNVLITPPPDSSDKTTHVEIEQAESTRVGEIRDAVDVIRNDLAHNRAEADFKNRHLKQVKTLTSYVVRWQLAEGQSLSNEELVNFLEEVLQPLDKYIVAFNNQESDDASSTATPAHTGTAGEIQQGMNAMGEGLASGFEKQALERFSKALEAYVNDISANNQSELASALGIYPSALTDIDPTLISETTFRLSRQLRTQLFPLMNLDPNTPVQDTPPRDVNPDANQVRVDAGETQTTPPPENEMAISGQDAGETIKPSSYSPYVTDESGSVLDENGQPTKEQDLSGLSNNERRALIAMRNLHQRVLRENRMRQKEKADKTKKPFKVDQLWVHRNLIRYQGHFWLMLPQDEKWRVWKENQWMRQDPVFPGDNSTQMDPKQERLRQHVPFLAHWLYDKTTQGWLEQKMVIAAEAAQKTTANEQQAQVLSVPPGGPIPTPTAQAEALRLTEAPSQRTSLPGLAGRVVDILRPPK